MKKFYVYGYVRLDTNTYFYIGKGHGNRYLRLDNRKKHFLNILNSVEVAVEILRDNLTEEEAFEYERDVIEDLVFNEGYSIDIPKFICDKSESNLVNLTWGGDGTTGYSIKQSQETIMRRTFKNTGKKRTVEQKNNISEGIRKAISEHPEKFTHLGGRTGAKLTEETKRKIGEANRGRKQTEETKNKRLETWYSKSEEEQEYINNKRRETCIEKSRENSSFIILFMDLGGSVIHETRTISDMARFMFENGYAKTFNGARASINECTKNNSIYKKQYKIVKCFTCND